MCVLLCVASKVGNYRYCECANVEQCWTVSLYVTNKVWSFLVTVMFFFSSMILFFMCCNKVGSYAANVCNVANV